MRIGLVSQEYPPETAHGGIGTQTWLKAHGLAALGHEVHVISASTDSATHEYADQSVRVTRVPGFSHRMPLYTEPAFWLTYSAEVAVAVAALHARAPFDLIDFPEWGGEGYIHLLNQTEWNHIPTVVQIHGPLVMFANTVWPEVLDTEMYRVGTMMEGTSLRLADAVYSSSGCSADWCARHHGVERAAIPVLHTGVDTNLFRPTAGSKEERPTILFVGRISRDKGAPLLVEVACSLAEEFPDLRLRMLGRDEGGWGEELLATANRRGHAGLLDLPGYVGREELAGYLAGAHVFAAPSEYEPGPGLVNLEAMACGLPVIACSGAGAAEVITPDKNGILVPPRDAGALAAALRSLLANPVQREAMGARARRYVEQHADSRACLRRLEQFYKAASRGGPRRAVTNDMGAARRPEDPTRETP